MSVEALFSFVEFSAAALLSFSVLSVFVVVLPFVSSVEVVEALLPGRISDISLFCKFYCLKMSEIELTIMKNGIY